MRLNPFGSTRRTALAVLVLVIVAVGGAFAAGILGAPTVTGVENRFGDVNEKTTTIQTDLTVSNPNPANISLGGVDVEYTVDMNDVRLAQGTKDGLDVERGETTVPFVSHVDNERIPAWWVSHIRNDEHTELTVDATVTSNTLSYSFGGPTVRRDVDTDIISAFNSSETRPVNANRPLLSDPVLYVNETHAEWGDVNESVTPIRLTFTVYNPKTTPVAFSELGYDINMNGVDMGAGATDNGTVIPPRSTRTIVTTTYIDNDHIDEWWVTHLRRNQTTDLRIEFYAKLGVRGTTVRVPLDSLTYTQTIETDIFGNKNETGDASTATPAGDATGTSGDERTTTARAGDDTTTDGATTAGGGILDGGDGTTATATETATTTPEPTSDTATTTASTTETTGETTGTTSDGGGLLG